MDVVKVPHHGSSAQSEQFLLAAQARVAVVSVGAGNDYGHPAGRTLDLLAAQGTRVWRTDLAGAIAISGADGVLKVRSRG